MEDTAGPHAARAAATAGSPSDRLTRLIYRSRATDAFHSADLADIVSVAQARNAAEGLSGALIYDAGQFLQWLEGPKASLDRIAASLCVDGRHDHLETLAAGPARQRAFAGWTMQLAVRGDDRRPMPEGAVRAPGHALDNLLSYPEAAPSLLRVLLGEQGPDETEDAAERAHCVEELVRLFTSAQGDVDPDGVEALCRCAHCVEDFAALYDAVARALGDLWIDNKCSSADITMALCEMQIAYRRLRQHRMLDAHWEEGDDRALVAQVPGDPHMIGAILKADLLRARGWQADLVFPRNQAELSGRLAEKGYDALVLATSRVLSQSDMVSRMEPLIASARQVSRNPGLTVVVGGRAFADDPMAWHDIGADAACASPVEMADVLGGLRAPIVHSGPAV